MYDCDTYELAKTFQTPKNIVTAKHRQSTATVDDPLMEGPDDHLDDIVEHDQPVLVPPVAVPRYALRPQRAPLDKYRNQC